MPWAIWQAERTVVPVRWDALFADLQARWEAESAAELDREIAEAARLEQSTLRLADRLRGHLDVPLSLRLRSGQTLTLTPQLVGEEWLAGTDEGSGLVVPLESITVVEGLRRRAAAEASRARRGLGIGAVLRAMARDRAAVTVMAQDGAQLAHGLLAGVGRAHLEVLAAHAGEVPRPRGQDDARVVPFSAIGLVRADVAARL